MRHPFIDKIYSILGKYFSDDAEQNRKDMEQ